MVPGKTAVSVRLTFGVNFIVCIPLLCLCLCVLIGLLAFHYLRNYKVEMEILYTYNIETKENLENPISRCYVVVTIRSESNLNL